MIKSDNDSKTPHSQLILLPTEIEVSVMTHKNIAYKYLSDQIACDSFIEGNIWFTGTNQNRFYHDDPYEHFYDNHSRILTQTLSLSLKSPNETTAFNEPCIEIFDVRGLVNAIRHDLLLHQYEHQISWLDKNELLQKAEALRKRKTKMYPTNFAFTWTKI